LRKGDEEAMTLTPEIIGFAIISVLLISMSVFGAKLK
jgi:hypothetical protein